MLGAANFAQRYATATENNRNVREVTSEARVTRIALEAEILGAESARRQVVHQENSWPMQRPGVLT